MIHIALPRLLQVATGGVLAAAIWASSTTAAPPPYAYTGQGISLRIDGVVNPTGLNPIIISDTAPLPLTGGNQQITTANVNIASGALTIASAVALANSAGPQTQSHAEVNNFHVEFIAEDGEHCTIDASHIQARATTTAAAGPQNPTAGVTTVINNFKFNGVLIPVTGAPNQVVVVGDSTFIFNEQTTSTTATSADADGCAVHFFICNCIEGRIAIVHAGVTKN